MKLQYRLSLSYLAVVFVFCLVSAAIWIPYSARPAYQFARRELQLWVHGLAEQARQAQERGGFEEVVKTLKLTNPPPDTDLTLWQTPQQGKAVWGSRLTPSEEQLRKALAGEQSLQMPKVGGEDYKAVLCVPLKDPRGHTQTVLALAMPVRLPPEMREYVTRGILISVLGGAGLGLALALFLSYRIARPVEALTLASQRLGQGDLTGRVTQQGGDELADLATQFNRMAESLQQSVAQLNQEKARMADLEAAQRQFLADVSHNLRTPLSAILGWTEALQDGIVAGQEGVYLERIHTQTNLVAQKVARLLELSRWQSSEPLLHKRVVPLSEPLLQAVEAVAPAAEKVRSRLELTGDIHHPISVDGDRLRDVLQILLENAVEHAGPGVEITVHAEVQGAHLVVEVGDNGQGARAHDGPKESRGLGLTIARRLVEAHGGEFHWESQSALGTRARLSLPLSEA